MTTNHIEKLDPALIRPGRVDRRVEFKLASRYQCEKLFAGFYREVIKDDDVLRVQAKAFAAAVPDRTFPMSKVQVS